MFLSSVLCVCMCIKYWVSFYSTRLKITCHVTVAVTNNWTSVWWYKSTCGSWTDVETCHILLVIFCVDQGIWVWFLFVLFAFFFFSLTSKWKVRSSVEPEQHKRRATLGVKTHQYLWGCAHWTPLKRDMECPPKNLNWFHFCMYYCWS